MVPSNMEKCRFCGGKCSEFSSAQILSHTALYLKCEACGSLQVANPFWLADAHKDGVHDTDAGLVQRSLMVNRLIGTVLTLNGNSNSSGIDWGGGAGLLTRLLRNQGFQCLSHDKYASQQLAAGFIANDHQLNSKKTFVTAIECVEHLIDPINALKQVVRSSDIFIFTVELLPFPTPNPADKNPWWYFVPEAGQHITFPSKVGLESYRKELGFNFYTQIGLLHIFSREKIQFWLRTVARFPRALSLLTFFIQRYNNKHFYLGTIDTEFLKQKSVKP